MKPISSATTRPYTWRPDATAEFEEILLVKAGALVDELLEREGLRREEVDLVVPAQLSPRFLAGLPAAIGCAGERVADLTDHLPDTHSTSVLLALDQVLTRRPPATGSKLVLLAFGSGLTLAGAVYRC